MNKLKKAGIIILAVIISLCNYDNTETVAQKAGT